MSGGFHLKSSVLVIPVLTLLLRILLDISYVLIISPNYSYAGLVLRPNGVKIVESYVLMFICMALLPKRMVKPSDMFVWVLFLDPVLPMLAFYALADGSRAYMYATVASLAIVLLISRAGYDPRRFRIARLRHGQHIAFVVFVAILVFDLGHLVSAGGLRIFNLNLMKVYLYRDIYKAELDTGMFGYLNVWAATVINPYLMCYGLHFKKRLVVAGTLVVQVLLFGLTSSKAFLFFPVLILFPYFFVKNGGAIRAILGGLAVVVGACIGISLLGNEILPISLLVRRTFFLPAQINFAYHGFFSTHPLYLGADSGLFGRLAVNYYLLPPQQIIGVQIYGDPQTWANTGFMGMSYGDFGYLGLALASVLAGVIFKFVDALTVRRVPLWIGVAVPMIGIFDMCFGTRVTTALLTDGLSLALVLLWLCAPGEMSSTYRGPVCVYLSAERPRRIEPAHGESDEASVRR